MPHSPPRLVVDTNIWISFLIGKELSGLDALLTARKAVALFSDELFEELLEVLHRPKFRRYFSTANIKELIELVNQRAEWIQVTHSSDACRDEKDNFLLDLCLSGSADYLVTGDGDLLDLHRIGDTEIIHYRGFIDRLTGRSGTPKLGH